MVARENGNIFNLITNADNRTHVCVLAMYEPKNQQKKINNKLNTMNDPDVEWKPFTKWCWYLCSRLPDNTSWIPWKSGAQMLNPSTEFVFYCLFARQLTDVIAPCGWRGLIAAFMLEHVTQSAWTRAGWGGENNLKTLPIDSQTSG